MNAQISPTPLKHPHWFWRWSLRVLLFLFLLLFVGSLFPGGGGSHSRMALIVGARNDVQNLTTAVNMHRTEYGAFPNGGAAGILRTLRGDNPRKIVFFEGNANRFTSSGAFLDPWDMPYHFDRPDPDHIRVYSSGLNRIDEHGATDSDDIVAPPAKSP